MDISAAQISAGMGLVGLHQAELAELAGITQPSLNDIIKQKVTPKAATLSKLRMALESRGVEFLPRDGVARRDDAIQRLEGPERYLHLLYQIDTKLKGTGEEVLFSGVDHRISSEDVIDAHNQLQKHGIKARLLTSRSMDRFLWPRHCYHVLPDDNYVNSVMIVFGDYTAVSLHGESSEILIFRNAAMARGMRGLFEGWWQSTPMPEAQHV